MQLSDEIIDAFVKTLPNGEKDNSNGYELYYGTVKVSDGKTSVILDGSPVETPLNYLTMGAENGDRVTCIIKDHSLIVTGNLTHPSEGMTTKYIETMTVLAQEAAIGKLIATEGDFTELTADSAFVKRLMSDQVGASILTADEAFVGSLQSQIVTADKIKAMQAEIGYVDAETLEADYIDAETIKANYLQADMANLKIVEATKASIATLLADIALIKNATISQGHITGALDSVTLNANKITAGSLSVDRLYINGSDGKPRLVKFDSSGKPVATTIDASILTDRTVTADKIVANSITANEISTDFITAFRADIMQTVTEHLEAIDAEIQNLISGDTTITSLTVKSNTSVGGQLTVTGSTILKGSVTMNSTLNVAGALTAKSLKLTTPLPETSGGTGVNNFNDLFKVFRDRDYRLNHTHTNLLNPTAKTQTKNGVTFTNNGDGTYAIDGTASGNAVFTLVTFDDYSILENIKLVGSPVGGGTNTTYSMYITCYNGSTWLKDYVDHGDGVLVSNIPSEANSIRLLIIIRNGYTANNLLFKPMITTDLSATYDDFVQYSGDGELNKNVAEIYKVSERVSDETRTNLFNPNMQTRTYYGVTFTNNGDGTYTVNGTASGVTSIFVLGIVDGKVGQKMIGCPHNAPAGAQIVYLPYGEWENTSVDSGDGTVIQAVGTSDLIAIAVGKGTTCNNLLFKPMLTTDLNATYDDYVPYTGDSGRLNEDVSNKLSKSGGTMTGSLILGTTAGTRSPSVIWQDKNRRVWAGTANGAGEWYIWDTTNNKGILCSGKSDNVLRTDKMFKTEDGFISNGAWMDFYYGNVNRLSIFANGPTPDADAVFRANVNNAVVYSVSGRVILSGTTACLVKTEENLSVANNAWNTWKPVLASAFTVQSSRLVKENIEDMTDVDAQNILELRPVHFDYKENFGGQKDRSGLIAEEVIDIIPEAVVVPEGYDEANFDESKGLDNQILTIDYSTFVPHLIKLCQIQQEQIDALTKRVEELEK